MGVHYALINSGYPLRNGVSVNQPPPGVVPSGGANYILDAGWAQHFPNIDGQTAATNNRYIKGGSGDWEKGLG